MEIIRIGAAGIACVLAAIFMKTAKPEYSVYLTMAAGLFILAFAVGKFSYLYESLKKIQQYVPVDTTYMNILMKMIGITYIGQFSAGICKDAGYSAVAGQIEIYERLAVLAISSADSYRTAGDDPSGSGIGKEWEILKWQSQSVLLFFVPRSVCMLQKIMTFHERKKHWENWI